MARYKMQYKYIKQVIELYDDFHLVFMPLEDQEVRGTDRLIEYGNKLLLSKDLPEA